MRAELVVGVKGEKELWVRDEPMARARDEQERQEMVAEGRELGSLFVTAAEPDAGERLSAHGRGGSGLGELELQELRMRLPVAGLVSGLRVASPGWRGVWLKNFCWYG